MATRNPWEWLNSRPIMHILRNDIPKEYVMKTFNQDVRKCLDRINLDRINLDVNLYNIEYNEGGIYFKFRIQNLTTGQML